MAAQCTYDDTQRGLYTGCVFLVILPGKGRVMTALNFGTRPVGRNQIMALEAFWAGGSLRMIADTDQSCKYCTA
jgi:hypothetical protein